MKPIVGFGSNMVVPSLTEPTRTLPIGDLTLVEQFSLTDRLPINGGYAYRPHTDSPMKRMVILHNNCHLNTYTYLTGVGMESRTPSPMTVMPTTTTPKRPR